MLVAIPPSLNDFGVRMSLLGSDESRNTLRESSTPSTIIATQDTGRIRKIWLGKGSSRLTTCRTLQAQSSRGSFNLTKTRAGGRAICMDNSLDDTFGLVYQVGEVSEPPAQSITVQFLPSLFMTYRRIPRMEDGRHRPDLCAALPRLSDLNRGRWCVLHPGSRQCLD